MRLGPGACCESPRITARDRDFFRPTVGKRRLAVGAGTQLEDYVKENCPEMNGLRVDRAFRSEPFAAVGGPLGPIRGCRRAFRPESFAAVGGPLGPTRPDLIAAKAAPTVLALRCAGRGPNLSHL